MSSTTGNVHDFESYPTPPWAIERLLERVWLPFDSYLEPCAGDGNIIRAIAKHTRSVARDPVAIEIQPQFAERLSAITDRVIIGDCLEELPRFADRSFPLAITNTPFSLAFPILKELRRVADWVVLLLRVGFFEGGASPATEEKAAFLDEDFPDLYILPHRPPFSVSKTTGKPGQDSSTYCWAVWTPEKRREGKVTRLAVTPREVRKEWANLLRERAAEGAGEGVAA